MTRPDETAGRARLAGWYQRLLWAYPPQYRREELLDTLLEAAGPGRRRPTGREAANLVRHGMRARLGRPASRGIGFMYLGRFPAILALVAGLGVLALAAIPRRRPFPAGLAAG